MIEPTLAPETRMADRGADARGGAGRAGRGHGALPVEAFSPAATARSGDEVDAGIAALWHLYGQHREMAQRDRLILHYAPLVKDVAGRVAAALPAHVDTADLMQSGIFGLVDAIERFDPERGPKFETYAMQRVRGAILDDLRAQDWVPRSVRSRAREMDHAIERLEARMQRSASDGEIADELGIAVTELRELYTQLQVSTVVTLDELAGNAPADTSLVEALPGDSATEPGAVLDGAENRRMLARAVAQLAERDRMVVTLYYFENLTLAEVGTVLGVTESRVCQLHARAVVRLRGALEDATA